MRPRIKVRQPTERGLRNAGKQAWSAAKTDRKGSFASGRKVRRGTWFRPGSNDARRQWKSGPDPSLGNTEQRCGCLASALAQTNVPPPGDAIAAGPGAQAKGTDAGEAVRSMIAGPFGPPERLRRKTGRNAHAGRSVAGKPRTTGSNARGAGHSKALGHLPTGTAVAKSNARQQARVGPGSDSGPHLRLGASEGSFVVGRTAFREG